jgi:prepilin-type processing-associated H-X9-DG protein
MAFQKKTRPAHASQFGGLAARQPALSSFSYAADWRTLNGWSNVLFNDGSVNLYPYS